MNEQDLAWPPWLEDLTDSERIRAIVTAVANCYAPDHREADGQQHCTVTMAEHFLAKMLEDR
jgi:hypothetical protein